MKSFTLNQEDLSLMSIDLEFNPNELHPWNEFYGHSSILKKYSLFKTKYFFSTIEHGVRLDQIIWHVDKNSPLNTAITNSQNRKKIYKEQTTKYVFDIGSIINYVKINKDITPSGSVYFLPHSTHHVDVNIQIQKVIANLKLLPKEIIPEYICIYWKDILRQKHTLFIESGFKVICAGHIYDDKFLFRLKEIFLNFKTLITSELGSHVFHAHNCGLDIVVPLSLVDCYDDEMYRLDKFMKQNNEKQEHDESFKYFEINNNFFIDLFNKNDFFSEDLKKIFLNYFCSSKKLSRLNFTLVHLFSWGVYKLRPKGFILHLFDYLYVRLDRRISRY